MRPQLTHALTTRRCATTYHSPQGLVAAARTAGVNFIYWASGSKSPAFEADTIALAKSCERPSIFFAANARTNPKAVREDVACVRKDDLLVKVMIFLVKWRFFWLKHDVFCVKTRRSLEELGLDVLDAVVVQYIRPEEDMDKVEAALKVAHELKAEGLVRHVAASTHDFSLAVRLASSGLLDAIMLR